MNKYVHPEVLVSTDWVLENLDKPDIKIVEISLEVKAYDAGHIPGAVGFNWETQTQDQIRRDIVSKADFEKLLGESGISPEDTVVIYGDFHNWFAAYGFWVFKIYGHQDVRLMNGGRAKWLNEDKPLTPEVPTPTPVVYKAREPDLSLRAFAPDVLEIVKTRNSNLIDVRSPDEFSGKIIAPAGMNETAQRAGHIPGAASVPWSEAVQEDGTFKSYDQLKELYFNKNSVDPEKETVAYCRIGERSSHSWFALRYLLGLKDVKNYDGSWTEYGNLVGAPIEKNGSAD